MSDLHDAVKFHMDAFFKAGMKAGWKHTNNFGNIGHKLARLGRVTDAEFEVIEPNNEQDERPDHAGNGNDYTEHRPTGPRFSERTGTFGHHWIWKD